MNFEIEIVEAYRLQGDKDTKKSFNYSVHIYIAMFDIDIRGIILQKKSNGWFALMPSKSNYDEEEQKRVFFPILEFTNPKTKKEFILQIKKKFVEYMDSQVTIEIPVKKRMGFPSSEGKEKLEKMSQERNKNPRFKGK